MKTILLLFHLIIISCAFGQNQYIIDFDSPWSENNHIIIDTISNQNNIWRVGIPHKIVFDSAYSRTHAIMTDTINSYPTNDTSSFIIKHIRPGNMGGNESLQLNFWFKFNSDTLTDYGKIEASINNGLTWINLMTEDTIYYFQWLYTKPVLSGNSNGWEHFGLDLRNITYMLGYSDTIMYRITFISDSIQTNKEGWMIDDFQLADWWEGIENNQPEGFVSIFPNPTNGILNINSKETNKYRNIQILNYTGQVLDNIDNQKLQMLNLCQLKNGVYLLKYTCNDKTSIQKFIINK